MLDQPADFYDSFEKAKEPCITMINASNVSIVGAFLKLNEHKLAISYSIGPKDETIHTVTIDDSSAENISASRSNLSRLFEEARYRHTLLSTTLKMSGTETRIGISSSALQKMLAETANGVLAGRQVAFKNSDAQPWLTAALGAEISPANVAEAIHGYSPQGIEPNWTDGLRKEMELRRHQRAKYGAVPVVAF